MISFISDHLMASVGGLLNSMGFSGTLNHGTPLW